jgi:hypothetical protein
MSQQSDLCPSDVIGSDLANGSFQSPETYRAGRGDRIRGTQNEIKAMEDPCLYACTDKPFGPDMKAMLDKHLSVRYAIAERNRRSFVIGTADAANPAWIRRIGLAALDRRTRAREVWAVWDRKTPIWWRYRYGPRGPEKSGAGSRRRDGIRVLTRATESLHEGPQKPYVRQTIGRRGTGGRHGERVHALGWLAQPTRKEGIPPSKAEAAVDELVTEENKTWIQNRIRPIMP